MFQPMVAAVDLKLSWPVATAGYRIEHRRPTVDWWWDFDGDELRPKVQERRIPATTVLLPISAAHEQRTPLTESGLFRRFANLECTDEAILDFASKYGLLTMTDGSWYSKPEFEDTPEGRMPAKGEVEFDELKVWIGEERDGWHEEIKKMKLAVALWDASRTSDEAVRALAENQEALPIVARMHDRLDMNPFGEDPPPNSVEVPALVEKYSAMRTRHNGEDVLAQFVLRQASALFLNFTRALPKNRLVLQLSLKNNLRAGLWTQFALAVHSNAEYKLCERDGCGAYIETAKYRRNRKYCSRSCNTQAWNLRHPEKVKKGKA